MKRKASLHLTIDRDLAHAAREFAKARRIALSALFQRALDRYLLLVRERGEDKALEEKRQVSSH